MQTLLRGVMLLVVSLDVVAVLAFAVAFSPLVTLRDRHPLSDGGSV